MSVNLTVFCTVEWETAPTFSIAEEMKRDHAQEGVRLGPA